MYYGENIYFYILKVEIWNEPRNIGMNATILVAPNHVDTVLHQLSTGGVEIEIITQNVQE